MEQTKYRIQSNGRIRPGNITKQVGVGGQRDRFGILQEDFLSDWKSTQAKVKTVDRMLKNSPLIGGALRLAVEMSIRKVDWFFTSKMGEDDPDLELVNEAWNNLTHSWADFISDAVLSAFYGWSTFTNKYERVNGRLLWRKFKFLGPETHMEWIFDEDGGLIGLQQYPHLWPDPISIDRMIIIRFRHAGGNPEGESILRPAWTSYYYGSNLEDIRAIGYERHAAGLPMVKMPRGADASDGSDDHTKAKEIVRNIRVDEQAGLVIPPASGELDVDQWRVELMSAGNAQVFMALNSTINEYDQKMLIAALSQFIILGINKVGSQSKAETDVSFFTMAVNAFADTIAETFTKHAVNRLLRLNGREEGNIKLEHSPAGDVNADMMIEFIKTVGGNMTWTADDEIQIRSIFGMPEMGQDELEKIRKGGQFGVTQAQVLNGAQITSAISIIDAYARGLVPRENAVFMISTFFNIPADVSEQIVPTEPGQPQAQPGQLQPSKLPPNGRNQNNDDMPERDDSAAMIFEAGNAPDDDKRRRMEGRWQRAASKYFSDALKRVTNGSRGL